MKYELIVMGFLLDRPMHGYHVIGEVKTHRMDSWARISPPMIYKTLIRLESKKMIKPRLERNGLMPQRKVYRLTAAGRKRLVTLTEKALLDKNLTQDLSNLGYFFIFALPKDRAMECLGQKQVLLTRAIESMKKRLDDFRGKTPLNRFMVIQKDLDRFKSELVHLKQMTDKISDLSPWTAQAFAGNGGAGHG